LRYRLSQIQELFHSDTCLVQNLSQRSGTDTLVIWHDHLSMRIGTLEDNVAAFLPIDYEPDA
jgi:hypothetical protein